MFIALTTNKRIAVRTGGHARRLEPIHLPVRPSELRCKSEED
jgi:hypothetical protein